MQGSKSFSFTKTQKKIRQQDDGFGGGRNTKNKKNQDYNKQARRNGQGKKDHFED